MANLSHDDDQDCTPIDPRSGFCKSNFIFYSKRKPITLPSNHYLDVTTFISSRPHQGKVAFIDAATGYHLSYSDLWRSVYSVASCLSEMGIRKGDVVFLLSVNSIFFPIVCLAVMSIGAIITATNPLNTAREISGQLADSKPVLTFTLPELVPKLSTTSAASSNPIPVVLIASSVDNYTNDIAGVKIVGTLQDMMNKEPNNTSRRERVTQDDVAALLYSSGTSGVSKGVISTHGNLIAQTETVIGRFRTHEKGQTYIATVPMFHTYGMASFAIGLVSRGCPIVILSKFDMEDMLSTIEKYKVTFLPIVPPICVSLMNNAERIKKKYDVRSLKYVLCGGAPISQVGIEGFLDKFPNVVYLQGYALTESNGAGASLNDVAESRRLRSSGMLTPSTEARIVNPNTGEWLSVNQNGELWLRGPSIMKGYFRNKEATAATLTRDGWLRTGDICYIDDDGFLYVVDRLKELIKYNGYQVPPAELEALLVTHPEIADAAVIPFPDEKVGQYPMAYVVSKTATSPTESEIMDFISKQVAPYKKIRKVAFVASIPKNPSGKILRKDLIKLATSKL